MYGSGTLAQFRTLMRRSNEDHRSTGSLTCITLAKGISSRWAFVSYAPRRFRGVRGSNAFTPGSVVYSARTSQQAGLAE